MQVGNVTCVISEYDVVREVSGGRGFPITHLYR